MSPINFLSKSRGKLNLAARIGTIVTRFSFSPQKYEKILLKFCQCAQELGCAPTFPITAITLKRHPDLIQKLSRQGIDFAVHGYIHTDHSVLTFDEQVTHFKKAVEVFSDCGIPFTGFRAPFVRINKDTLKALSSLGFVYDSSFVVDWRVLHESNSNGWREYERILKFYNACSASDCAVVPRIIDGCTEIPVCMPDDETMIERLGFTGEEETTEVWKKILEHTHASGELFTVQLHPERFLLFETALRTVVEQARRYEHRVWMASLKQIADWWQERQTFTLNAEFSCQGRWKLHASGSDRATLLIKNLDIDVPSEAWLDGYRPIPQGDYMFDSGKLPVIGVAPDAPSELVDFLRNEGYIVETGADPATCGLYLDDISSFTERNAKAVYRRVEDSGAPLVKWWRWPDGARSALSVTGDIDSLTLQDFAKRVYENWRQSRISRNGT